MNPNDNITRMKAEPELVHVDSKVGIIAIQNHHLAVREFREAGHGYPTIPAGKNTIWHHFVTRHGHHAVIVNQTGFVPTKKDNEERVNGCIIFFAIGPVALGPIDSQTARDSLETFVRNIAGIA